MTTAKDRIVNRVASANGKPPMPDWPKNPDDMASVPANLLPVFKKFASIVSNGPKCWSARCPCGCKDEGFKLLLKIDDGGRLNARCFKGCDIGTIATKLGVPVMLIPELPKPEASKTGKTKPDRNAPAPELLPQLLCMEDVEATNVKWLWPDRFPLSRLSVFSGRPGLGKTFFMAMIAAHVSRGWGWPDRCNGTLGSVIMLNGEDDPSDVLKPRLVAAGADCAKVHVLQCATHLDADGKKIERTITLADLDVIEKALILHPDTKLVIVDPLGSFLGGTVDAHRDNSIRSILGPLHALAAKYGVAVILVCHTRKSSADFADDAILGSRGISGIARMSWHLSADDQDADRRLLLRGKNNLGKPVGGLAFRIEGDPATVVIEPELVDQTADDALASQARTAAEARKPGPAANSRDEAVEWLSDQLRSGPKTPAQLQASALARGISWSTVQRARKDLGIRPARNGFGGGSLWCFDGPATPTEPAEAGPDAPETSPTHGEPDILTRMEKTPEKREIELGMNGDEIPFMSGSPEPDMNGVEAAPEQVSDPVLPIVSDPVEPPKNRRIVKAKKTAVGGAG